MPLSIKVFGTTDGRVKFLGIGLAKHHPPSQSQNAARRRSPYPRSIRYPLYLLCVGLALSLSASGRVSAASQTDAAYPWRPEVRCSLNPSRPEGLHPDAHAAMRGIRLVHRITQGLNHSSDRGNVHDTDVTIEGKAYTAAVDISVRCLTKAEIKTLLGTLARVGFAGWYRNNGEDDWKGPPHIHAVWSSSPLKPILRRQLESWLEGRNGLGSDRPYRFWQPDLKMKEDVRNRYRRFNLAPR